MTRAIRTGLASAFAIASITGASVAFAADNGGNNGGNNGGGNNSSDMGGNSGMNNNGKHMGHRNKCADDNNATNAGANCTTEPNSEQQ